MATLAARRVEESSEARLRCSDDAEMAVAKAVKERDGSDAEDDDGEEDLHEGVAIFGETVPWPTASYRAATW